MKKFLVFGLIAGAGALMAGCSKDEAKSDFGQNAIEFGTYLGRDAQTRGTATTTNTIQAENAGFGVTAFYTGSDPWTAASANNTPNFMYNQQVTYTASTTGGAWNYSPVKYWPTTVGDKISFFAYAPYSENGNTNGITLTANNATSGNTSLNFKVATTAADMVDFVAGVQIDKQRNNADNADNTVKFTLKHELSRVGIKAKVNQAVYGNDAAKKTFVVIKSVKFDKAATDGQFYTEATYTFANSDNERGTWDLANATKAAADFDLSTILNTASVTAATAKTGTEYANGVNGIKLKGTETEPVSLFGADQYLFLIPVAATTTSNAEVKATATISYDIVTEDSNLATGYSCTSATKTVSLPAGTLVQGKAYNYVFTINVDEVKLSAEVDVWDTDTDANVPVDYKDTDAQQ